MQGKGLAWRGDVPAKKSGMFFFFNLYIFMLCMSPPLKVLEDREHILLIFLVPHCIGILWLCYDAGMWVTL